MTLLSAFAKSDASPTTNRPAGSSQPVWLAMRVSMLGLAAAVMVGCWGWVLPRLAQQPSIRQQIDQAERLGINPGALYYTDVFVNDAFAPGRAFRESASPPTEKTE